MIEDQIGERSLAKQQEKLEAEEEETTGSGSGSASASEDGGSEAGGRGKALLKADDDELERLDGVRPSARRKRIQERLLTSSVCSMPLDPA